MDTNMNELSEKELLEKSIRFEQEASYLVTIKHVKKMYKDGMITKKDFDRLNEIYIKKYNPPIPASADE